MQAVIVRAGKIKRRMLVNGTGVGFGGVSNGALQDLKDRIYAMSFEPEVRLARWMATHADCVGPPGGGSCPHKVAISARNLPLHKRRWLVDYDHGPLAEIDELLHAPRGLAPTNFVYNEPLLVHCLFGTEWISLHISETDTIRVCPNIAPRCSRGRPPHSEGGVLCRELIPKHQACHAMLYGGWLRPIFDRYPERSMLPFDAAVLSPSPLGAHILSEAARRLVEQLNWAYSVLF